MYEWDMQVLVDGFQTGAIDHVDLKVMLTEGFHVWVNESTSATADTIRKGYVP